MILFRSRLAAAVLAVNSHVDNAESAGSFPSSSRLQVHIPQTMFRPEGYDHRASLYGVPPYGGSITQSAYYADSDLCDPAVDTRKGYPIRPPYCPNNGKCIMEPWPTPYILMVDRGGCTFVQKVRNAQKAGAAGVVIADNTCLCSDKDCVSAQGYDACQPAVPIMAGDGSEGDISIPSFLMFKKDADKIKAKVRANHMVQMEMRWALPRPDHRVEYDLWTSPSDPVSKDFQRRFKPVAEALGHRAYFTPHMYIHDGVRSNCLGCFDRENKCFNMCTNNGRYCATNDLDREISGADVVKESLRRICIWKYYGESDGIGAEWWDYVARFMERCDTPDNFANEDCVKEAYEHANVDADVIDRCIRDSGGVAKDQTNTFLDLEMQAQFKRGVVILPTVSVNTVAVHGRLSIANIFAAICNGYSEGLEPEVCKECEGCSDFDQCIAKKQCHGKDSGSMSGPDPVLVPPTIAPEALPPGTGNAPHLAAAQAQEDGPTMTPAVLPPGTGNGNRLAATQAQEESGGGGIDVMCVYAILGLSLVYCVAGYILHRRYRSHEQAQPKFVVLDNPTEHDHITSQHTYLSEEDCELDKGRILVE